MHLPRMVEKIRRHWAGELSPAYQRTLGRGFDDLLCSYIDVPFEAFLDVLKDCRTEVEIEDAVLSLLPGEPDAPGWNRKLVQRGLHGVSRERLQARKEELGFSDREDIITMCDLIEVNEGRMP